MLTGDDMKKLIFGFVLVLGMGIVYFSSYANVVKLRSQELYRSLYETANTEENFEPFLRFVTAFYLPTPLLEEQAEGLKMQVYLAAEKTNETYTPLFVFFVYAMEEDILFSETLKNAQDKTQFTVKSGSNTLYDTAEDSAYEGLAISYGLAKYQGYYYIYAPLDETVHTYTLYDYEGNLLLSTELSAPYTSQVGTSYFDALAYETHYSQEAIIEMMDLSNHMRSVYVNTAIFSAVMVFVGLVVFRKKR